MTTVFPSLVVIKGKTKEKGKRSKYLRSANKEENSENETNLYVKAEEVTNPMAKFELIMAKMSPDFVHIRCCYINKYLKVSMAGNIQAIAEKPIEDEGQSSTMFKILKSGKYFKIFHKSSNRFACFHESNGLLFGGADHTLEPDVFKILDWATFVIFPEIVCFSHENITNYLSYREDNKSYLMFVDGIDIADLTAGNKIFTWGDGYVRIMNLSSKKYWCRDSDDYIRANSEDRDGNDKNTLFLPFQFQTPKNTVALLNLGNKKFCKKESGYLRAQEPSMTDETKLLVSETVVSRKIEDIDFHTDDVRVLKQTNVADTLYLGAENRGSTDDSLEIKISYEKITSATFSTSNTLKFGGSATIGVTLIPELIAGTFKYSAELTGKLKWEDTEKSARTFQTGIPVGVPPKSRVTCSVPVHMGTCDVPYSYTRVDKLYDGEEKRVRMHDGIYTGVTTFHVDANYKIEKIPDEEL
ncbi:uncharacterized protein LOC115719774 [Cannabis sativa]|uniref:Agglutinin domain-containing protein n=1 Tax=Cannabis sativa TaxID=3483 RepID=A0A7J6G9K5_CANSA|nr:uncharacterized protein LOC115719774 [Cannabis sativa]KAF4379643.1 hypothetical protein F8388_023660 [Cannabis sativa]